MYAQQERFSEGEAFACYAADAGYDAIEVSHSTSKEKLRAILDCDVLPVRSIHQPAPYFELPGGKSNAELNLAATQKSEHAEALQHALYSLEWAIEAGASALVVHLGEVEMDWEDPEAELYRLYREAEVSSGRAEEARLEMKSRRAEAAPAYLEAARISLEKLVEVARPHNVVIGIENRLQYHQIPLPSESRLLLEDFTAEEAGHWHDTGHAEVLDRLGFFPHGVWFETLPNSLVGAHVHDVRDELDHRVPGTATLDWSMVAEGLGSLDAITLEIDQHEPDEAVRQAPAFLRSVGLA
ncbi:MAG: hypothetical protein CL897_02870 [Dehalococcoidia bacterium]|nr:hypothetical protein [Dehalococcoidia bacterium]HCU99826.1 hypothetical protein [Dehalococcoidia bacterium]|tara:strand:+ start:2124 stop:3014 length:891 start_codon:yes stop_codon:yes gene_type:complete